MAPSAAEAIPRYAVSILLQLRAARAAPEALIAEEAGQILFRNVRQAAPAAPSDHLSLQGKRGGLQHPVAVQSGDFGLGSIADQAVLPGDRPMVRAWIVEIRSLAGET